MMGMDNGLGFLDALVTKDILKIDHNLSSISVTIMDIWRDIENVHVEYSELFE